MTTEKIKIANAPCSWGALEFDLEGRSPGFEQVLDEMAAAGYNGTELGDWGFMPTNPEELRAEVSKRNLDLLGAFVPVNLSNASAHEEGIDRAVKTARLMYNAGYAHAFIVLADDNCTVANRTQKAGRIQAGESLDAAHMKTFGEGAEKIAGAVKEACGLRTVFHHHCAGFIETPEEISTFLQITDPSLIGLCFDTGHYKFGGGKDELSFLKNHWDRIWHIHFKDHSPDVAAASRENDWDYFQSVRQGVFCELGKGDVDFGGLLQFIKNKHYEGWIVVEQDVLPGMGGCKACAENNLRYLYSKGL